MELLGALGLVLLVAYAGYVIGKMLEKRGGTKQTTIGALALLTLTLASFAPGGMTFAQSTTIDFDLQPFFDSLNQYLPIFIGLFALIGGIAGAMAISKYIIGAVVDAFSGKGL